LFGFLVWGWLRKRVSVLQKSTDKFRHIADLRQMQIVKLTTRLHTLNEEIERAETKVSLSEFKMRKAQAEADSIRAQLTQIDQGSSAESLAESDSAKSQEPTLADISLIMETGSRSKPQEETPDPDAERSSPIPMMKGIMPDSLEMARQIFNTSVDANDLKIVRGIDQKLEEILHRAGIESWSDLATTRLPALRRIIEDAGPRYRTYDPKTWAIQARMAAKGEWKKLKRYQDSLLSE